MLGARLEVEMSKKRMLLWREAHVEVKVYKTPQLRTALGGRDVEKVHAVVVRSTCGSENVQKTSRVNYRLTVDMLSFCNISFPTHGVMQFLNSKGVLAHKHTSNHKPAQCI